MSMDYGLFCERLAALRARMAAACAAAGRPPEAVRLLPVTKTQPAEAAAWVARAGLPAVGENRVQEALGKMPLAGPSLHWELIGHLQSNKAKDAALHFHRIQSVDSAVLPVLLEINARLDPAKFGARPEDTPALLAHALGKTALRVEGLMTVAPLSDNPDGARRAFSALRELRDRLAREHGTPLPELSMGMTGALEAAIAEGSTLVRVGTALFGPRPVPPAA